MSNFSIHMLAGEHHIEIRFSFEGVLYYLARDLPTYVARVQAGGSGRLEWTSGVGLTIAEARLLRDRLTRMIILAELHTTPRTTAAAAATEVPSISTNPIPKAEPSEPPSEALFDRLATEAPARLLAYLEDESLPPSLLTHAAEVAGRALPTDTVVPILTKLLHHESAIVREGAIYGLDDHDLPSDALQQLAQLADHDPSPGVRVVAQGHLAAHRETHSQVHK